MKQNNWKPVIESLFAELERNNIIIDEVNNGDDYEGEIERSKMVDEATACDECRVYVRIPGESSRYTLLIVLDEQPFDIVADWAEHPLLDSTLKAWSDSQEGKSVPTIEVPARVTVEQQEASERKHGA